MGITYLLTIFPPSSDNFHRTLKIHILNILLSPKSISSTAFDDIAQTEYQ